MLCRILWPLGCRMLYAAAFFVVAVEALTADLCFRWSLPPWRPARQGCCRQARCGLLLNLTECMGDSSCIGTSVEQNTVRLLQQVVR